MVKTGIPIFLIIFYSCSYEPILLNKKNDFQFVNISINGDNNINEIIKSELLRNNGPKKYNINLETVKKKQIVSSNEKGDPVVFKLNIDTLFVLIEGGEIILKNTINKQASYNNISDKFELSQKEENILENISSELSNEILMSIINLNNDN